MSGESNPQPIIILGVPRSGTTLLRVVLGSHARIHAAPETHWIVGGWLSTSVRELYELLVDDRSGVVRTLEGVQEEDVFSASRRLVGELLEKYRSRREKPRLLLKTPDDLGHLDFLLRLFPDSPYIHICRDGRDVVCSTLAKWNIEMPEYGKFNLHNTMQRWCDWEQRVRSAIESGGIRRAISLTYETLVSEPEQQIRRVCDFLAEPYEPAMLDYAAQEHDMPRYEVGSRDVRSRPRIDASSVGRWKGELSRREMLEIDRDFGDRLVELGYSRCGDEVDLTDVTEPSRAWKAMRRVPSLVRHSPRILARACRSMAAAVAADFRKIEP